MGLEGTYYLQKGRLYFDHPFRDRPRSNVKKLPCLQQCFPLQPPVTNYGHSAVGAEVSDIGSKFSCSRKSRLTKEQL